MPRYFFHVINGSNCPDLEGSFLANDEEARKEASVTAGAMISELAEDFWEKGVWNMTVAEGDRVVCTLTLQGRSSESS